MEPGVLWSTTDESLNVCLVDLLHVLPATDTCHSLSLQTDTCEWEFANYKSYIPFIWYINEKATKIYVMLFGMQGVKLAQATSRKGKFVLGLMEATASQRHWGNQLFCSCFLGILNSLSLSAPLVPGS